MKSLFTLFLSIMLMHSMSGQAVITSVFDCDLPGGTPKGVEIYLTQDIPDLTMLGISSANNGGGTTGMPEFTLPAGSGTMGQYLYISNEEPNFQAWFAFTPDYVDDVNNSVNINGDDAIELFFNGTIIDVFGDVDTDGTGEPWEYLDGWAARVPATGPDGTTFNINNWTFSGPGGVDGDTSNASAANPVPITGYTGGMVTADHFVLAQNDNTFAPSLLIVDIGDIVQWDNAGGFHNVNGSQATYPNNSEDFINGAPSNDAWTFQHTFNNVGYNEYQCDPHVGLNMFGAILVRDAGDHYVEVENNLYAPKDITIELGETVVWTNVSGFHNVNGTTGTYPNNPESFGNGAASLNWSYAHTFTIPGTYDYQCDPHVGLGMVGTVTVTSPYPSYAMSTIKQVDVDGNALFADSLVSVVGVVHGPNYLGSGIEFFLVDGNNDGIVVRATNTATGYTVTEGDELTVSGTLGQFNGLIQLNPDIISINSTGNTLNAAETVIVPTEATEGAFITIKNLTLVDPATWPDDNSNANVLAYNGTDTVLIRIDRDISFDIPAPVGLFDVVGLGSQFDNSPPRTGGYQILPRSGADIMEAVGTHSIQDVGITNIFPNPVASVLNLSSDEAIVEISIYNLIGNTVYQAAVPSQKEMQVNLTNNIGAGVYILKVKTDAGVGASLFTKK